LHEINDVQQEQDDLQKILEYRNLHEQLRELKAGPQFEKSGFRMDPQKQMRMINDIEQKIKEYDDYFMGEGRSHTVIAQQMFDTNKMSALDKAYVNTRYIGKDYDRTNYLDGSIKGFFRQLGTNVENIFSGAQGILDWALTTGGQGVDNIFGIFGKRNESNGYKTGEVIKQLDANDQDDRAFLYKLYKGYHNDVSRSIDENKLKEWQDHNARKLNELNATLQSDIKFSKDGKLFGIDIYDPQDIP